MKNSWNSEYEWAFKNLIRNIAKITYKAQPDLNKDFIFKTDAFSTAIDAILSQ